MLSRLAQTAAFVLVVASFSACSSMGSSTSFLIFGGTHTPEEGLVESVRDSQQESKDAHAEFTEAFQLYQRLTSPQAVALEDLADDFENAVEDCKERAEDLAERIDSVQREKASLIQGWSDELASFSSEILRKKSAAMMQETETRAQRVLAALERAQARMQPVLLKLQDYGLFFHHNLNARAIATLQDTYKDFDAEFHALAGELEKTQTEIAGFLAHFAEPVAAPEVKGK